MSPARPLRLAAGAAALAWWLPSVVVGVVGTLLLFAWTRVVLRRAARLIEAGDPTAARRELERVKRRLHAHGVPRGWAG